MTDNNTQAEPNNQKTEGVGERRPDQPGNDKAGMQDAGPASGADGAAGAGGPDGFGTGS